MFSQFVNYLSGRASTNAKKCSPPQRRPLRIETLEDRRLLSVSAAEFATIRAEYTDLNLSENMTDYNIIEVTGNTTNNSNLYTFDQNGLYGAISKAGTTTANDFIVVRTSTSQNKITLGGTQLSINIDATQYGSVTIVSLGTDDLTIDANQKTRVLSVGGTSTVALAGLTITGVAH